jgi:serine protease inhibitor
MLATSFMHRFCASVLCADTNTSAVAPLCAASTLVVVGLAATEDSATHSEFWSTLGVPPNESVLLAQLNVLDYTLKEHHENVELHTALALYCAGDVKDSYKTLCALNLGAQIAPLADARVVNAFIERETKGLLVDVVKSDPEPPMTAVGVVLFVGKWSVAFDPDLTQDEKFFSTMGKVPYSVSCRMMHSTRTFGHRNIDGMHVVELPYGAPNHNDNNIYDDDDAVGVHPFVAYFFLPPVNACFDSAVKTYLGSAETFARTTDGMLCRKLDLALPELDINCSTDLNDFLAATMPTAFSDTASFERLSDTPGVFLKNVTHTVKIKVDAVGTQAAAATEVRFATRGQRPAGPPSVVFNRPFFFTVVHKPTNTILFASAVRHLKPDLFVAEE